MMAAKGLHWKRLAAALITGLVVLIFAAGAGAQSGVTQAEVDALLAIKRGFQSPSILASWNESGAGVCTSWLGVDCLNGQVTGLSLPGKALRGVLAEDIGNLTSLRKLSLHHNFIAGSLPQSLGTLPALKGIALFLNQFSGSIPANLGNSSALAQLDVSYNLLTGPVPAGLTQSRRLTLVDFSVNRLWGVFPGDWAQSSSLVVIGLAANSLSGPLPDQWGAINASSLQRLDAKDNFFSGSIPRSLGARAALTELRLSNNQLDGAIPEELGQLAQLTVLDLAGNQLTGEVPAALGNLSVLAEADFSGNALSGAIPASLGATNLSTLLLADNRLEGQLPEQIGNLTLLAALDVSRNNLTGPLPTSVGNLVRLQSLLLNNNALDGRVPEELGNLTSLTALDMSFNNFSGRLPLTLLGLVNLTSFNVSYNNLSGAIPPFAQAFNNSAFLGNPGFCGVSPFPLCPDDTLPAPALAPASGPAQFVRVSSKRRRLSTVAIVCIALGAALALLAILCLCLLVAYKRKNGKKGAAAAGGGGLRSDKNLDASLDSEEMGGKLVHFDGPLAFSADHLLCATAEVLGKSAYGTVYKATLEDGNIIAVKRLREGIVKGQKEFESEVGTLGKIRHPNLLALRAYYWGPKDEKLLVFDYMACGSLAAFLHARGPETPLTWETRMKISMGAARGLGFLHESENIIHGNLTASNILLDGRMNARISDYGLARLMTPQAMSGLMATAGTLGYRAPELVKTKKATSKSDVYSFGIVLLELLTGKAPVEQSSSDSGMDLAEWVSSVVKEEWTSEVFDVEIIKGAAPHQEEEMMNTLQLALVCVHTAPSSRPEMEDVVRQLEEIRPDLRSSPESELASGPDTKK
ncbi:hypothetical protein MPTK1_7g09940 [Marchantia polymorpha subsp. ruderalis]|uniref:Protein kinase domain-containing protein n=3 Tax=Marchantia polymorpha TaxID=3197 RepID=A0AAF6BXX8_MARPO|nr:hypothetical protein MARPO_0003s0013 [Marchantia polymorpha]BBN16862.1 hypothetical protein Mp_7g09940 [Marchantia polymorpha subsp. ruderalis]|eukprot:PTQ49102.1 hypothetical protein MARPO_0003s0013 [Marchantia polymorpha]